MPDDIMPCDADLIARLSSMLPPAALLTGAAIDPRYQEDRRARFSAPPRFVIRPSSTAELSAALAACNDARQRLVIQGGRTGLSGAHRIQPEEAVLSLERMTGLDAPDPQSRTIVAGSGVPLQRVQDAADGANLMFGVDIGSRGTATVGGIIATNAGGNRVIRYGMTRAQVAGLEVVLADGSVLSCMRGLEKDNSGYDLKQLFVGSEGTLGVVTRALLTLHAKPQFETNALLAMPSVEAAMALLQGLRSRLGETLSAFEFMTEDIYHGAASEAGASDPLATAGPIYVLAEIQSQQGQEAAADPFMECLSDAIADGLVLDAVIANSMREFLSLWEIRDSCADYIRRQDNVASGDISVPVRRIPKFLEESRRRLLQIDPASRFLTFGHLADGNLHYVFCTTRKEEAVACLMNLVSNFGGSISAEHGIGLDKKNWLPLARSAAEIDTMKRLKIALDPNNILNSSRVLDPLSPAGSRRSTAR